MNHTDIGKLILIIKYRNYGVCLSYLLDYFHMSSSSFYFKTRLFFVGESIKAKAKQKRFVGFSIHKQAFIESHHSSLEREFVQLNSFENIEDVFQAYSAYMFFYHNLRPHGSLNYMTPNEFSRIFSDDNNFFNSKTIFVKK